MKAKVFKIDYRLRYDEYGYEQYYQLLKGVTDWDEISQEDIDLFRNNGYVVLEQLEKKDILLTVQQLKDKLKKEEEKRNQKLKKAEEIQEKERKKRLERKIARAKKLLEENNK